jgi:16S rRNA (uracil1498-N3)-methyltransferase
MEWLTEKATELGVTEIHWIVCRRTEKKYLKTERLNRIALSAMKQCGRPFLPKILSPQPLTSISWPSGQSYWATCDGERMLLRQSLIDDGPPAEINIFIGPEGDFTPEETSWALSHKVHLISLGPWRLRSETAALVALVQLAREL